MNDIILNAVNGVLLVLVAATVVTCILLFVNKKLTRAYVFLGSSVFGWLNFAIVHKQLFDSMDNAVFIMNRKRQVVNINAAASKWLSLIGFSGEMPYSFELVSDCLNEKGSPINDSPLQSGDKVVVLQIGNELKVYTLAERQVTDGKGRVIGFYASLTDFTHYSKMISELEYAAEIDQMTGMANRRVYERKCVELDADENLPLSIIIADVNKLKKVNDKYGHQHGDELLKAVAGSIMGARPENAVSARIGGDEFVMLAPHCTSDEIYAIMEEIKASLDSKGNDLFVPSVALGSATKTSIEQDLRKLISEADKAMYQQKEYDRRKERQ